MSYHKRRRALGADTSHGPAWYRAMGGVQSQPPPRYARTRIPALAGLGSLGDDPQGSTTLSSPTVSDRTFQWQDQMLAEVSAGRKALEREELQKWLQIGATISIPLFAAIWRGIFKRGASVGDPTT